MARGTNFSHATNLMFHVKSFREAIEQSERSLVAKQYVLGCIAEIERHALGVLAEIESAHRRAEASGAANYDAQGTIVRIRKLAEAGKQACEAARKQDAHDDDCLLCAITEGIRLNPRS